MEVGTCAGPSVTRRGDNIPGFHLSPDAFVGLFLQVVVDSVKIAGVAEDEDVSAPGAVTFVGYSAVGSGNQRCACWAGDVDTVVE